jgi:hypothetical protein
MNIRAIGFQSVFFLILSLFQINASAQENIGGPPDILQFPVEAGPQAPGALAMSFLRDQIEKGADLVFCETLMREAHQWPVVPPRDFTPAECLPAFKNKVAANEGSVHWESDSSRPTKCGTSCFSRPFMNRTYNVGKPNTRLAALHGYLNLFVEPGGDHVPNDRSVALPFDAYFECKTQNGERKGKFTATVDFGFPIVGDPGFWESVFDAVLAPANISYRTEAGIKKQLANLPTTMASTVDCTSIGALRPAEFIDDSAVFDFPRPQISVTPATDGIALSNKATIELFSIKRNPLPPLIAPEFARPGDPAAGQFTVFLNGRQRFLPPEGLSLPPEGGTANIHYCMTIDMNNSDRLQIIFTNDLGGSVWSQFYPAEKFGAGSLRKLVTGRTVVVPGLPRFDPQTGRPLPVKPEPRVLNEFELSYRINYVGRPDTVLGAPAPTTGGTRPGIRDVTGVRRPIRATEAVLEEAPPQPCKQL